MCREPLYCKAERACLWELVPLAGHVHPSVAAMARTLLAGVPIDYTGDPLRDLSVTAFLDKLVQRKPKVPHSAALRPVTLLLGDCSSVLTLQRAVRRLRPRGPR